MTLPEFIELLDKCGVEHGTPAKDTVPCFVSVDGVPMLTIGAVTSDGKVIQFRTIGLLTAPGSKHRLTLLSAMMEMNYSHKLVKFGIDPDDGEIVAYLDLVLGSATLTTKQLKRALRTFKGSVGGARTRFQKILDAGEDPGGEEEEKAILARMLLEAMAEGGPSDDSSGKGKRREPHTQGEREKADGDTMPNGVPKRKSGDVSDAIDRMMRELEDEDDVDT